MYSICQMSTANSPVPYTSNINPQRLFHALLT